MVGSKVVIKDMTPSHKLALKYKPEQFNVVSRNGSELVVQSEVDGRQYRRNVTHTKLLPTTDQVEEANVDDEAVAAGPTDTDPSRVERPKRNVGKPARYQS